MGTFPGRVINPDAVENGPDLNPEGCIQLWTAVVHQAVQEAQSPTPMGEDAREWVLNEIHSKDFFEVCDMAGIDPFSVRARVRQNGVRSAPTAAGS